MVITPTITCPRNDFLNTLLESFSIRVVRLGQKNSEIVGKRHDLILFGRAQKIVRLLRTEGCQQSMRIEFFGCHGSTLLACAIGTTFSATAGDKKEIVFLFEDSTVWAMPKPALTPEDVEAHQGTSGNACRRG